MKSETPKLRREVTKLKAENRKLHEECRKYRVALNRIAYPEVWGLQSGDHVGIATKALVVGLSGDEIPHAAMQERNTHCHRCGEDWTEHEVTHEDGIYCNNCPDYKDDDNSLSVRTHSTH